MRPARALRPASRALHVGARERHLAVPHAQHLVALGELGQRPHGFLDDLRPRGQALDPRHGLVLATASVHAGHQVAQRHRDDTRLTERRQDLLDVAQEQSRGADEKDTRAFEALAVGVEQVCDAVQRDSRLAGAGAALDDQKALVGRANDAVLLRLDGGDDITHSAVAGLAEGVHEGTLALKFEPGRAGGIQQLVFETCDASVTGGNVAAAHDTVRLGGGGLVEGACGGGAPVNEQGSAVLVGQGESAHVAGRMVGHVEAAKHQTLFDAF